MMINLHGLNAVDLNNACTLMDRVAERLKRLLITGPTAVQAESVLDDAAASLKRQMDDDNASLKRQRFALQFEKSLKKAHECCPTVRFPINESNEVDELNAYAVDDTTQVKIILDSLLNKFGRDGYFQDKNWEEMKEIFETVQNQKMSAADHILIITL
uniref:Uncharacterized protein n=1 Tax=Panagrolaimus davidi TaxID=227884 RepID=A0A914PV64_9BILA